MSSFPFINTGKCWSFPCLMELERVVMVRTFPNYKTTKIQSSKCNKSFCKEELSKLSVFCRYLTFATLPCSRQSCSSSLSIPEAHRGLKQRRGITFSPIDSSVQICWLELFSHMHFKESGPDIVRTCAFTYVAHSRDIVRVKHVLTSGEHLLDFSEGRGHLCRRHHITQWSSRSCITQILYYETHITCVHSRDFTCSLPGYI